MIFSIFEVELAHEDDGRWSTWTDALPGCAAWGYTKEEALQAMQDAAEAYVEDMLEAGEALPSQGVVIVEAPVRVAVGAPMGKLPRSE